MIRLDTELFFPWYDAKHLTPSYAEKAVGTRTSECVDGDVSDR
jgi:hypothetical protein